MTGKWHVAILRVLFLVVLILPASAQDRYLVRVNGNSASSFARNQGLTLLSSPADPKNPKPGTLSPLAGSAKNLYVATLGSTGTAAAAAVQSILKDPAVQGVEQDQPVALPKAVPSAHAPVAPAPSKAAAVTSTVPLLGSSWYYGSFAWSQYVNQPASGIVGISQAHRLATGAGTVAYLDTGADFTNSVLASSLNQGWDFTNNVAGGAEVPSLDQSTTSILDSDSIVLLNQSTTSILDQSTTSILDQSTTSILDGTPVKSAYGHGTMIAGIVHLVAPTARLLPVKVFGNDGTSSLSLILSGLYWAVDHGGANVINMSFSMTDYSQELANALNYANSQGVICVASVGNDGEQITLFPAGYNHTMGVASTNNSDKRSTFSNYGSAVTVAAPGEGIISPYPGNRYAAGWGTSFSAPFVSGAAALLIQLTGNINESQAEKAVEQADNVGGQGLGAGRLDLSQACSYEAKH